MGFDQKYWDTNYSEPLAMDGIVNAHLHARYLHSLFQLEGVVVNSLVDLGFGLGHLFEKMIKIFKASRVLGLEPSLFAFEKVKQKAFFQKNPEFILECLSLQEWCRGTTTPRKCFDLGICTSVWQYLPNKELEAIVPVLSKRVKYLYLTVPTDEELEQQVKEYHFLDPYALHRTKQYYWDVLLPHFTIVSGRLLESRTFFKWPKQTSFTEHLYRLGH